MNIPVTMLPSPEYCVPEVPNKPLFITDRKCVGNPEYGFGQSSVQLNGKVWVNEIYVREKK